MRKLKPKYLFASAALLILLVVVVYVVTRSKETTPNGPSAGSDEVARTLDFGTPETPGSPEIQPVTAQPATPYDVPTEVAPVRPTLQEAYARIDDVIELLGNRVEHIDKVFTGEIREVYTRIDGIIDVLGDRVEKVNEAVEYCHDRVWRIEDQLKGETEAIDQLLDQIGDPNLVEY